VLALAVFMIDAWRALPDGRDAVLQVLPTTFNWPLFWVALLLMASPALHQAARKSAGRCARSGVSPSTIRSRTASELSREAVPQPTSSPSVRLRRASTKRFLG
jgi:hypothetical protein